MHVQRIDLSDNVQRGAVAGLLGAASYLGAMALDMALTRQRTNDIRLLGELPPVARRLWPLTGTVAHFVNGALLGALFGWVQQGLPGPAWVRGLLFAQVENLVLWPAMIVLDRVHPSIRRGTLARYNRPIPILAEILRHAAYGIALGAAYGRLGRR